MLAEALEQFAAEPAPTPAPTPAPPPKTKRPALRVVKSDADALLDTITKASRDPSVTVEKVDQLIRLYEQIKLEDARRAFTLAMNEAQADMEPIAANATNDATQSQYATYGALDRVMRPIYIRHGFTVSFTTEPTDRDKHERVVIILDHVGGHQKTHRAEIPSDGLDDAGVQVMTRVHATASAFTYGQRYLLGLAFNIAVDKDRDGNTIAQSVEVITTDQAIELASLMDAADAPEAEFLRLMKVDVITALPASQFDHAKRLLNAREAR